MVAECVNGVDALTKVFKPATVVRSLVRWGIAGGLALLLVAAGGYFQYGDPRAWFAKFGGHDLLFDSRVQRIDRPIVDDFSNVTFSAKNVSRRSITIAGSEASCGCVAGNTRFPLKIEPSTAADLNFIVEWADKPLDSPKLGVKIVLFSSGGESEIELLIVEQK